MGDAPATTQLPRHSLIDVDPRAWATMLAAQDGLAMVEPVVRDWVGHRRPLIARRRLDNDPSDRVAAGLPLPPGMGKRRLAFALPPDAIVAVRPPPALAAVRGTAPLAWRETIDALLGLTRAPRVFGSFAWAALTGLDYVEPASDLDLLWALDGGLPSLLHALESIEKSSPGRLDGEILGPAGAVNWRELAGDTADVLVKTPDGVVLMSRGAFLGN